MFETVGVGFLPTTHHDYTQFPTRCQEKNQLLLEENWDMCCESECINALGPVIRGTATAFGESSMLCPYGHETLLVGEKPGKCDFPLVSVAK